MLSRSQNFAKSPRRQENPFHRLYSKTFSFGREIQRRIRVENSRPFWSKSATFLWPGDRDRTQKINLKIFQYTFKIFKVKNCRNSPIFEAPRTPARLDELPEDLQTRIASRQGRKSGVKHVIRFLKTSEGQEISLIT